MLLMSLLEFVLVAWALSEPKMLPFFGRKAGLESKQRRIRIRQAKMVSYGIDYMKDVPSYIGEEAEIVSIISFLKKTFSVLNDIFSCQKPRVQGFVPGRLQDICGRSYVE